MKNYAIVYAINFGAIIIYFDGLKLLYKVDLDQT